MSDSAAQLSLSSAPSVELSANAPKVTAPGAQSERAPGAIDPRHRRLFIPPATDAAPIERPDWATAYGPVGSFAWAKAKAEALSPLGDGLTPEQWAEFERRFHRGHWWSPDFIGPIAPQQDTEKQQLPETASDNGAFVGIDDDGRVYRLDDAVACTPIDETPTVARVLEAREAFEAVCEDETGIVVDSARKRRKDAEEAALLAQTHRIAKKLETAGTPAYLATEWTIGTVGVHSLELKTLPKFRRKTILPFVAQKLREPRIRSLEYWLQFDPWARFWTLTGGPRVPLRVGDFAKGRPAIRRALKRLHARINDLNDADFMRELGVRIVWRSSELGSVERKRQKRDTRDGSRYVALLDENGDESGGIERDADGTLWFHPHAHCLVHLEKGRIEYGAWCAFLEKLRAWWGDWMDDAGVIRNPREAVKYITKPGEIERLSPEELAELDRQLSRLHMVQPLGKLAEQIREIEEAGDTLLPEQTDDGRVWRRAPDVNKRGKASKEKQRIAYAERDAEGRVVFVGKMTETEFAEEAKRQSGAEGVDACCVVAQVAPGAASNCVKEPRVVVMFKRYDAARIAAHPLVQRLRERTAEAWAAGCRLAAAEPIRVHTGTSTAADPEPASPPGRAARPRDPQFAAHLARLDALAAPSSR
ncbi:hypothetical protein [Oleiharenicola sp. Vm1]|uniref:hypothetical protein n=1 Tax=Oleiharenicola sp. Vm1 TaxID=3398393 RepID=UPI0039F63071